jgi:microcystin-dependent protein
MDNDFMPVGAILMHCSDTIPNNWLICNGSPFSSVTYPKLAEVLLDNYGSIIGTDYKLPDFRGRIPISNVDTVVNSRRKVGVESVTLTASETGVNSHLHAHTIGSTAHSHTLSPSGSGGPSSTTSVGFGGSGGVYRSSVGPTNFYGGTVTPTLQVLSNTATSATTPHNNVMPYLGVNFIIKAN